MLTRLICLRIAPHRFLVVQSDSYNILLVCMRMPLLIGGYFLRMDNVHIALLHVCDVECRAFVDQLDTAHTVSVCMHEALQHGA